MHVDIDDINESGPELIYEEKADSFPALGKIISKNECTFLEPVSIRIQMRKIGDMITAMGSFDTRVRLNCSRCLQPYEAPLYSTFDVTYIHQLPDSVDPSLQDEVELQAEEIGMIQFSGNEIDLRDAIQEEVIMALPMTMLCRSDCKGLCTRCGADLNQGNCGCDRKVTNPQFDVLKNLKVEKS
jgi:uncharacterized protein